MKCKFVVGQKIVCVNARPDPLWGWSRRSTPPETGAVYTVTRVGLCQVPGYQDMTSVWLREIHNFCCRAGVDYPDCGYAAERFRPVKTTSIAVFEAILRDVKSPVRAGA